MGECFSDLEMDLTGTNWASKRSHPKWMSSNDYTAPLLALHVPLGHGKVTFNFWLFEFGSHPSSEGKSHIWQLVPYKGTRKKHKTTPTTQYRQYRPCTGHDLVPELRFYLPFAGLIFEICKVSLDCAPLSPAVSFFACPFLQRANTK